MFCKINGKYYVKVSNFYQEVEVKNNNIVPIQGEANRLYSPVSGCIEASVDEILKASKKLNNWRLSGCVMYTTLEPCYMCMEAIKQSRIEQVFFILNSLTTEDKNIDKIKISDVYLENQVKLMVKKFFEKYRK